jgi:hypothetical protein
MVTLRKFNAKDYDWSGAFSSYNDPEDGSRLIDSKKILSHDPKAERIKDDTEEEVRKILDLIHTINHQAKSALVDIDSRMMCNQHRKEILSLLDIDYKNPDTQKPIYYRSENGKRTFRGKVVLSDDPKSKEVKIVIDRVFNDQGKRVIRKNAPLKSISVSADAFKDWVERAKELHKDNLVKDQVVVRKFKKERQSDVAA